MGVVNKLIRGYYADNGGLPTWNNNKALEEGRWKTPFSLIMRMHILIGLNLNESFIFNFKSLLFDFV